MYPDRAAHLAELTGKIHDWKADVARLEQEGRTIQATVVKSWIKSAERVTGLLSKMRDT
jgi:hypothetical protein